MRIATLAYILMSLIGYSRGIYAEESTIKKLVQQMNGQYKCKMKSNNFTHYMSIELFKEVLSLHSDEENPITGFTYWFGPVDDLGIHKVWFHRPDRADPNNRLEEIFPNLTIKQSVELYVRHALDNSITGLALHTSRLAGEKLVRTNVGFYDCTRS